VAAGAPSPPKTLLTQRRYAESGNYANPSHPDALAFLLDQIRRNSGQVTLIAIGPLMNVGAAIDPCLLAVFFSHCSKLSVRRPHAPSQIEIFSARRSLRKS
jgi:hypothetical protein